MSSGRLEAFGDAMIAVVIRIMVLDLHAPDGSSLHDLPGRSYRNCRRITQLRFIALYLRTQGGDAGRRPAVPAQER